MKMGPRDSYICLIPKPLENTNTTLDDEVEDLSPARSWSLLQSLSGTCLYVRAHLISGLIPALMGLRSTDKAGLLILTATTTKSGSSKN